MKLDGPDPHNNFHESVLGCKCTNIKYAGEEDKVISFHINIGVSLDFAGQTYTGIMSSTVFIDQS